MQYSLSHIPYSCCATALFIAGICWKTYNNSMWLVAAAVFMGASIFIAPQAKTVLARVRLLSLSIILFAIGSVVYQRQQNKFELFNSTYSSCRFNAIGTISSIERSTQNFYNTRLTIHLLAIKPENEKIWQIADANIYIFTSPFSTKYLDISDKILLKNITLKKATNNSYNTFLIKENCMASLFMTKLSYRRLYRPSYSFSRWLWHYKSSLVSSLREKIPPTTFHFFAAVFLGNPVEKNSLTEDRPYFKAWGIMHHLARSGLHLVFFILLLNLLLNILPFPFLVKQFSIIGIVLLYSLLSWESIPFNRALLLFLFQKISPLLKFQAHTLHLLSCVTLITLFENPMRLFFLDFQLSFGITYALIYFSLFNEKNTQ